VANISSPLHYQWLVKNNAEHGFYNEEKNLEANKKAPAESGALGLFQCFTHYLGFM